MGADRLVMPASKLDGEPLPNARTELLGDGLGRIGIVVNMRVVARDLGSFLYGIAH